MKLALGFRHKLAANLPTDDFGRYSLLDVRKQFDQLKAHISAGWNIQHTPAGAHLDITAKSVTSAGALVTQGPMVVARLGQLVAATITANQNNYTPVDENGKAVSMSTLIVVRLNTDASRTLTGLAAPSPQRRHAVLLLNVGGFSLVLAHDSGSSSAINRFTCPGSVDLTVRTNGGVWVYYDIPASASSESLPSGRWRVIGI